MGFDKPDLAFVIHYQRPSSVVHFLSKSKKSLLRNITPFILSRILQNKRSLVN